MIIAGASVVGVVPPGQLGEEFASPFGNSFVRLFNSTRAVSTALQASTRVRWPVVEVYSTPDTRFASRPVTIRVSVALVKTVKLPVFNARGIGVLADVYFESIGQTPTGVK